MTPRVGDVYRLHEIGEKSPWDIDDPLFALIEDVKDGWVLYRLGHNVTHFYTTKNSRKISEFLNLFKREGSK